MPTITNFQDRYESIEKIIKIEWEMFQKVNNINGRASCQDEWGTFHIMRFSNYSAWNDDMINSYIEDLDLAVKSNRNLVMEKYAYMMEYTQNEYYKSKLEPYLPKTDDETLRIINEITQYMIECEKEISTKYPKLSKAGRTIESEKNNIPKGSKPADVNAFSHIAPQACPPGDTTVKAYGTGETTVEAYATGELKTYSSKTLKLYLDFIRDNKSKKQNIVLPVKDMMVRMSGYASLEDAESKL